MILVCLDILRIPIGSQAPTLRPWNFIEPPLALSVSYYPLSNWSFNSASQARQRCSVFLWQLEILHSSFHLSTMTMATTNARNSVQILFVHGDALDLDLYMNGGILAQAGTSAHQQLFTALTIFYASKHPISFVFNVAGRCCSTRLVHVRCHVNLIVQALSHCFRPKIR